MTAQPDNRDLLKGEFPALAELRDRLGMRTTYSEHRGVHWVVRIESETFDLTINKDRGDDWFHIHLHGSQRSWELPTVLHEMGLWADLSERVDHRRLARVLDENLAAVLRHIGRQR